MTVAKADRTPEDFVLVREQKRAGAEKATKAVRQTVNRPRILSTPMMRGYPNRGFGPKTNKRERTIRWWGSLWHLEGRR